MVEMINLFGFFARETARSRTTSHFSIKIE
nr:MAG TPA: hypothetical protein [Caudoviricetes sp.]